MATLIKNARFTDIVGSFSIRNHLIQEVFYMTKMSPKEFMQSRRPEKFSDSTIAKKGLLNRSLLEYKLDAITSNSQEQEFQNLCVKLAQLELAPNLRAQTGPTGGGDSKADSETYPISEFTRLNFCEGLANTEGERWAIAISAKKDWIAKVKADVKGIVETNRDYKRIYFITNQFAKDKKRAEIEDDLGKQFSVPVTILDRTWILDRVFENNRQKLAISELNLGEGLEDQIIVGPNDGERFNLLKRLNDEIELALSNAIINVKVVDKALDTALLARGLGKSRFDVDGLFDRAIRMSEQLGMQEQIYTVKYQKAWTTFFWYEDYRAFIKLFDELQSIAEISSNIYTLERQYGLSNLLRTISEIDALSTVEIESRVHKLKGYLMDFVNDDTRPSAAHQARMLLALNELFENASQKKDINKSFKDIGEILKGSERLIGFSYEMSIGLIQENGDIFGEYAEYENLINLIAEIDGKRKGEIPAAKSLLKFGLQHLESERYYKAIEYIGKALVGLYKKESKDDFIRALYFIAFAYEAVGLPWAARGSLIHAASYATSDFKHGEDVNEIQVKCCRRLKMLELKLGRVGYILEWHETELILSHQLAITAEELEEILKESLGDFSGLLGCLLLKTKASDLAYLEKAPDIFDRLNMDFSGLALLYLLGGERYLPEDYWQNIGNAEPSEFFNRWYNQPAREDLPEHPEYYLSDIILIESHILGTRYIFETSNSSPGIEIAEMIAASLEAFLATAINLDIYGKISDFEILLAESSEIDSPIQLTNDPENGRTLRILYQPFNPHLLAVETQVKISDAVRGIIIRIVAETIAFSNFENSFKKLLIDQQVDQRSLNFQSPLVMLGNVLGHNPRRSIRQWYKDSDKSYPFDGIAPRVSLSPSETQSAQKKADSKQDRVGESVEIRSHKHMKTFSVINEHLWKGHVWRGFAFAIDRRLHPIQSPILYLMFDNRESAIAIFTEWKERFGEKSGEKIRISLLKGIDAENPYWYKGLIGPTIPEDAMKEGHSLIMMPVISTMTPTNPDNLEGFLASYVHFGYFTLAPFFVDIMSGKPEPLDELGFIMRKLTVKNAWEVGLNDFDMAAILATDNPFIPKDKTDAPVLDVLKMKRES